MRVTLPEDISDITLKQFQLYSKLIEVEGITEREINDLKIHIFADVRKDLIEDISRKDYLEMITQIDKALNQDAEFQYKVTIDNTDLGFIPNFDKIKGSEWVDLKKYEPITDENNVTQNIDVLHNLMAILFRPITERDKFGNYKIETYNGTDKWAKKMKRLPMNVVNGALVFFYNLANELTDYTLKYTEEAQAKDKHQQTISLNGNGTQPLMN